MRTFALVSLLLVASCASTTPQAPTPTGVTTDRTSVVPPASTVTPDGDPDDASCPDVLGATLEPSGDGTYRIAVTVRSADTQDVYADRWEVVGPSGEVLATRVLTHPHIDEQPFSRSLSGVAIPEGVASVTIRAGMTHRSPCGATVTIRLP